MFTPSSSTGARTVVQRPDLSDEAGRELAEELAGA
jgi:hypothetical protein